MASFGALGACGDDEQNDVRSEAGGSTTTTAGLDALPDSLSVTIVDFSFQPATLTAKTGDVIKVKNNGQQTHTFTSNDAGFDTEVPSGDTGDARVDTSTPGTYDFGCSIHSTMKGKITVEA